MFFYEYIFETMKNNIIYTFLVMIIITSIACAKPGDLDKSFGTDGKVTKSIPDNRLYGVSLAIQKDNKIILAGYTFNRADFALSRYNIDGELDTTFGDKGIVLTDFSNTEDFGYSVALAKDGKIVVGGWTGLGTLKYFALARYDTNGVLDDGFGTYGMVTTAVGTNDLDNGLSVAIQDDEKILLAGSSNDGNRTYFALVRYDTNGTLDNSFGSGGKIISSVGYINDEARAVAIQADGKIVLAGLSQTSEDINFALARYNYDGTLDSAFGTAGVVSTFFGSSDKGASSLVIQKDGKLVIVGTSDGSYAVLRYNSDGSLDSSFNGNGMVVTNVGGSYDYGNSVAIQTDDKILVGGTTIKPANSDFALVRYNSDGSFDNTFGNDGIVITDFDKSDDVANCVAIQRDGKILLAGYMSDSALVVKFALARYLSGLESDVPQLAIESSPVLLYPNPVNGEAIIEYYLTKDELITIELFDISGKLIKTYFSNKQRSQGNQKEILYFDESIPAGSYILSIKSGSIRIRNINIIKE
jgi:uncharacterized delta-60 repeat protein